MKVNRGVILSLFLLIFIVGVVSATITGVWTDPAYPTPAYTSVNVHATITADSPATSINYTTLYYSINNAQFQNINFTSPYVGYAILSNPSPRNGDKVTYYVNASDNLGNFILSDIKTFYYDGSPPTVSVTRALTGYVVGGTDTATAICSDTMSGCDLTSPKLYISPTLITNCPTNYSLYISTSPSSITTHSWVCAAAKDNAKNVGFSSPIEFTTFDTIQSAISTAPAGTTINIMAGNYIENGQIIINKNLNLVGADKNSVIIQPAQDTGVYSGGTAAPGDSSGWFLVQNGVNLDLSKVTLDGSGKNIAIGILSYGSGNIHDSIIKNMKWGPNSTYRGFGVMLWNSNMAVNNNIFSNFNRIGVLMKGSSTNGLITGNTFNCKGIGDWLDYAVELGAGAKGTVSNNIISNCLGVASVDNSTSAGILVTTYFGAGTTATITSNTISNSYDGIAVGYDTSDTSIVTANLNNLAGNTHGIDSTGSQLINAQDNWWGFTLQSQIAPLKIGNVLYLPWAYDSNIDTDHIAPTTLFNSPGALSLHNADFSVSITDTDTGGAGLAFCKYRVRSYNSGTGTWYISKDLALRPCNTPVTLSVGSDSSKACETEGVNVCSIEAFAVDNSGNNNSNIAVINRNFSIDFTQPFLNIISPTPGQNISNMAYFLVQVNATDYTSGIRDVNLTLKNSIGGVIINNARMSPGIGDYEYLMGMWNLLADNYTLIINATDNAGNVNSTTTNFTITSNVAPSNILAINSQVPITGGTVSFLFNVTIRGGSQVEFGMDNIAGLTPTILNATISNSTTNVPVGDSNFNGAGVLTLPDLDTNTPNTQGTFILSLTVPSKMVPGNYPINYHIGIV